MSTINAINELPRTNSIAARHLVERDIDAQTQPKDERQLVAVGALLGLAGLLLFLNHSTGVMSGLMLAVQLVLDVVLVSFIALLSSLLTDLALGVCVDCEWQCFGCSKEERVCCV
ncbi:hypothetical protein SVAN01_10863 [Stagonosporopsis vannaccii]|nr:hypothetical protein SVAN01_10863 [Stagonosporopsis vannaccii]